MCVCVCDLIYKQGPPLLKHSTPDLLKKYYNISKKSFLCIQNSSAYISTVHIQNCLFDMF